MGVVTKTKLLSKGLKAISECRFALAADLGQSRDPTAICVMEHVKTAHVSYSGRESPAGETFDVRYLQRLPLGLSYVEQVQHIANLLGRPPLNAGSDFLIDETGVGRPVGDLFEKAGLRPTRITITAGDNQTRHGERRYHVPKTLLISALDARLHTGELRFASSLSEADTLRDELRDFRRHISAAGRFSYDARSGKHDDLVLACALALFNFVGRSKIPVVSIGKWTRTNPRPQKPHPLT